MIELSERSYAAFLFDMDGTLLTSIASAERVWSRWAERHGLDVATFLPTIHGIRSADTIRNLALPGVDPEAEALAITLEEIEDVSDVRPIPGAEAFVRALPDGRWAIVTSAPRNLAIARIRAAGLPIPPVLVCAEDVAQGKPAPDGYIQAAGQLGFRSHHCLVFEDAPAGIQAGEAAGADVLVITETHAKAMADIRISARNYERLQVAETEAGLRFRRA
ncbi:HAD-IA family hydrolase [Sphingomonas sp. MMS24-J13]|uniref:HAD-IA family hydrolase n=1 Tax=Sphingomonas sp. MMS24-J13 TaxID=3238686 RepID=UPI00385026EC